MEKKFYQKEIECMDRSKLETLQSERLVKQVERMYDHVALFKQRMDELNLKPSDIKGIEDLSKLPFSYKKDLRDCYPYGLFATPLKDVVRIHASSGTTGKQIVVGYTENDLEMWRKCVARAMTAAGLSEDDFIQNCYGYGLFTGGLGIHEGATKLGATVIPASVGNSGRQIQTMIDFGATGLCATPSYAMHLAEQIEDQGLTDKIKLKAGLFGAEPWTEEMRKIIESKLKIKAYDIYGLSEVMGPGVAYECECQSGMHVNEDNFIVEVVDPDTGEVLPKGSLGELVFTSLTKEAFPVIRYRTHDLGRLIYEPCPCGRTFIKMSKPQGRSDDMLIIRGVNVFPSQIEEVLLNVSGITPNYLITVDRVDNNDKLEIKVEISQDIFFDDIKSIEKITAEIEGKLRSVLGIGAKVILVGPKTIERSEGKAKRVIDKRILH